MAISINNRLITFAQQELVLARNDAARDKIKASLEQLEKKLKDNLRSEIKEFIRFGSYTRNTILPRDYDPESDIDLMVVFNTDTWKKTPGTYRKNILDVLTSAYPYSISKKDFPAVKLELNHIKFDLVPAYCEESYWSNNRTYYIPDSNDGWRSTVPNDINDALGSKNQSYGNNIVRNVIRLCKCWNAGARYPWESYEMEKWILSRFFYSGDNLYDKFLSTLNDMAGDDPGVRQALDWIREYKGTFSRQADEQKQFEWLQRLLPGLE
jgi:predicted nucleotidyltransferase